MNGRVEQELALLRTVYPDLEWHADSLWVRIPSYLLPAGIWRQLEIELAFQIPENVPGQQPYGFWVRPNLEPVDGGTVSSYSYPVSIALGEGWGQFSWSPMIWQPQAEITIGSNMLNFARSIADRLREGA
jgi:hypothetical protein